VQENPGNNASLTLPNIKAPKNGYCYVYVSNESDEPVYFDNLRVGHTRGRIIEENHYYSYGLKIAAISSQKRAHSTFKYCNRNVIPLIELLFVHLQNCIFVYR
jgi:hypothetical protein